MGNLYRFQNDWILYLLWSRPSFIYLTSYLIVFSRSPICLLSSLLIFLGFTQIYFISRIIFPKSYLLRKLKAGCFSTETLLFMTQTGGGLAKRDFGWQGQNKPNFIRKTDSVNKGN